MWPGRGLSRGQSASLHDPAERGGGLSLTLPAEDTELLLQPSLRFVENNQHGLFDRQQKAGKASALPCSPPQFSGCAGRQTAVTHQRDTVQLRFSCLGYSCSVALSLF